MNFTPKLFDLSHTLENGLVTFPGLPSPVIRDHLTREASRSHYAPGTEFHIGAIDMVASTGTYIDAPFHRWAEGPDVADLPLSSLAGLPGEVVRVDPPPQKALDAAAFAGKNLEGKAVLVQTGWSAYWKTEAYFHNHPYLTGDAADYLVQNGAALVGIDSMNIDSVDDGKRPVHSTLLAAGIPIVEHLTDLALLPDQDFLFFAVPVKVRGLGSFPVRAFGLVNP